MQQGLNNHIAVPAGKGPDLMPFDGSHGRLVGTRNHEIRNGSAFETRCVFYALLLHRIQASFDALDLSNRLLGFG